MEIAEIRKQIDTVDQDLLDLFLRRMELAKEIGLCKKQAGLPIYNPTREREILAQVTENSPEGLDGYARALFTTLFELSRSYQGNRFPHDQSLCQLLQQALQSAPTAFPAKAVVACQGIEGAYSQQAADKAFSFADILYFKNFNGVFRAVEKGLCRYGVLPIENSSHGSVNAVYDLMRDHSFYIVHGVKLHISHNLLARPGAKLSAIKEIVSHEQAIGQCSLFLDTLPDVKITRCENTAVAAQLVASSGRADLAAISSADCATMYGLDIVKEKIHNNNNNYTRFIIIAKKPEIYPGANKISILFTTDNTPGALTRVLSRFSSLGVNLSKLESRPVEGTDFHYVFYADLEGSVYNESIQALLSQLANELELFVFLGAYSEV